MSKKEDSCGKLFYGFSLSDRVPENHLLRQVRKVIDHEAIWRLAAPYYSSTGAPSVDPAVVLKMALLGYLYGITSERRLAEECRLNLAFLWFLGYDLDEEPPDHSILSKARARFGHVLYEQFFSLVVGACRDAGLIVGDKLLMDSTLIKANASLGSLVSRSLHTQLPSMQDFLQRVWTENPAEVGHDGSNAGDHLVRDEKDTVPRDKGISKLRANERRVSKTDPDAAIMVKDLWGLFMAYKVHIAVDDGPSRVVTGVVATPGDAAECHQVARMIGQHTWRVRRRPSEIVADKAYGTRDVYRFLRGQGLKPSIRWRQPWKEKRNAKLAAGFRYDAESDNFICPEGKRLYRVSTRRDGSALYKVHRLACRKCPKRDELCKAGRPTMTRNTDEDLLNWANEHLSTPGAKDSLKRRMAVIEPVFAEMKGPLGLGRASLRGTWKVYTQALMAMAAHNLKKLIRTKPTRRRAPAILLDGSCCLRAALAIPSCF